ncbi:MAG: NPCBM/NEW2 domain-containing protein [Planctomycetota bacterium]|nr:NPCBM/NEW2 domain-containing protein [Planctomycetota bacterium]
MLRTTFISILAAVLGTGLDVQADPPPPAPVKVSWSVLRQEIDGFGASGASHQAGNLMKVSEPYRTEILDLLFSREKGLGLSIVRNVIGDGGLMENGKTWGSETDGPTESIEPTEGQWNWKGDEDQIWLMKEAARRGCTRFISAAWSPPAWMKTNHSVVNGGSLKKDKYRAYAEYLAEYVNGYKKHHGIDIYAVSPQNEPTFTGGYSCCQWSPADFLDFTKNHVKPVWAQKNVPARFMLGEHMFWDEGFVVPSLNDPEACGRVDIVAAHAYGDYKWDVFPVTQSKGKKLWQTEVCNNFEDRPGLDTIDRGLFWAEGIHNQLTVAQVNAWLYWWVVSQYGWPGPLVNLKPCEDPALAVFRSEVVTRQTPGRAVDIDVNIAGAKTLYLSVDVADGRFNGDRADWIEPRLTGPKGELKLTDLKWTSANAGYKSPAVNQNIDGDQGIIVNGVKAAYGISTHAQSMIAYLLPPGYTRFRCKAGLDELCMREADPQDCTVRFLVYTDDPFGPKNRIKYRTCPTTFVMGNFSRFVRPGWFRLDAPASPASGVLLSAYKDKATGEFALVVINKNDSEQPLSISLDGVTASAATPYRTSAKENLKKLDPVTFVKGTVSVTLAPKSVTTFVGKAEK